MKKRNLRICAYLLAMITLCSVFLPAFRPIEVNAYAFENTYVNTGDQRKDIIGVALTQVGYTEGKENDSKYGTWFGMPQQPWCATFISWCARQAEIPEDVLQSTAVASPHHSYFNIPYKKGTDKDYTPQPGDLFFTKSFSHVGLVYRVEGDKFYAIEGNGNEMGSNDGQFVIINEREISKYYFGIPNYKGSGEHDYVREEETAHPHRTYYRCRHCGDQYYTGYTACYSSCGECMSCGCSAEFEGYYISTYYNSYYNQYLNIRDRHSASGEKLGNVGYDTVVYVYGATSANGWAHIEYDGVRGHVLMQHLQKYYPAPAAPTVSADRQDYTVGDPLQLSWTESANAEGYRIVIYKDGEPMVDRDTGMERTLSLPEVQAGTYEILVYAGNKTGSSVPGVLQVTVRDTYTVRYEVGEGATAPQQQTQTLGQPLTLHPEIPVREGYTFLGWTPDEEAKLAQYLPGDSLQSDADLTLYAVWKSDTATPESLQIERMPVRRLFLLGETLDTTGLKLRVTYSDGTAHRITEGFTAEGFSAEAYGVKTVTVTYETVMATYDTQIVPYIPGDMDNNKIVDREDVIHLLFHVAAPDMFPIDAPADFTGDGQVDREDVIQLLFHVAAPDMFPLQVEEESV